MDLLIESGVDISDWANYAKGPKYAAANPKYCYQWSFVEPGRVVVLCLWHEDLKMRGDDLIYPTNMRQIAGKVREKSIWYKRSIEMDKHLQLAFEKSLPIRMILGTGKMRHDEDIQGKRSNVKKRILDNEPWGIERYDISTGECVLVRSKIGVTYVDQFSYESNDHHNKQTKRVTTIYQRSAGVRTQVLYRAMGYCEYCGDQAFRMPNGRMYLETHHITPLSEGGPDSITNVIALCPNHHREAHHGERSEELRRRFNSIVGGGLVCNSDLS